MPTYEIDVTVEQVWSYKYLVEAENEDEAERMYMKGDAPLPADKEYIDTHWEDGSIWAIKEVEGERDTSDV